MTRKNIRFYLTAFFSGAAVLVIETIGVRILAPYLGAAYVVWVNIIGVILAALAVGYWVGGVAADRTKRLLPLVFFLAAVAVSLIPFGRRVLPMVGEQWGIRTGSLVASLLLFAPANILLGMVTPYLVKLAMEDPERVGECSGTIFAASTIGSIVATFATGFLLIPNFSTTQIIWGVAALLLAFAAFASLPMKANKALLGLVPLVILASEALTSVVSAHLIYEKDSQYYNIRVVERQEYGFPIRVLLLDGSTQGAKLVEPPFVGDRGHDGKPDYLIFQYIQLSARLIDALKPAPVRVLAIGGGACTIPEYIQARYPGSDVTVVEIDPAVNETAKRYFLGNAARSMRTVEADGRVFLKDTAEKYDLIYTDAYNGAFSVPWHLATREALMAMRQALRSDGILIVNVASSPEGKNSNFFRAFWKTCNGLFTHTAILTTRKEYPGEPQNLIILATKSQNSTFEKDLLAFEPFRYRLPIPVTDVPVLTDEHAPTDSLIEPLVLSLYPTLRTYME